jgi:hypothetical protein
VTALRAVMTTTAQLSVLMSLFVKCQIYSAAWSCTTSVRGSAVLASMAFIMLETFANVWPMARKLEIVPCF